MIGHSYEFERALPYQAIVEMLRSAAHLLRQADLPTVYRAVLARLAPDVLGLAGSPVKEAQISLDDLRAQLFEAILQAFLALARSQPLLLLFEDVHWAAESTLDWLIYIAPRLSASRLLVVITYRTNEVGAEHALARLGRRFASEGTVSTVALKPLSREANREWIAHLSGLEEQWAFPVADRLFTETAGNPFFLQEIVRGLIEMRQIVIDDGRWMGTFVEAAPGAVILLPESLRETIKARLERLTEMARAFIRLAAVAGRVFDYEIVQHAEGWTDELALGALEDLLARGFIQPDQAVGGFVFAHHLVRVALAQNDSAQAQSYVQEILEHLEHNTLAGAWEPFRVYLTCYQVLQATQDSRAHSLLNTAYHLLQERARKIDDEAIWKRYLEEVTIHREIVSEFLEMSSKND